MYSFVIVVSKTNVMMGGVCTSASVALLCSVCNHGARMSFKVGFVGGVSGYPPPMENVLNSGS